MSDPVGGAILAFTMVAAYLYLAWRRKIERERDSHEETSMGCACDTAANCCCIDYTSIDRGWTNLSTNKDNRDSSPLRDTEQSPTQSCQRAE